MAWIDPCTRVPTPASAYPGDRATLGAGGRGLGALTGGFVLVEPVRARTAAIVFGTMAGLIAAYLGWLLVRGPQALQLGVTNGWVGTAFRLAAAVICLSFGLRRRPRSWLPIVFGVALLFTAIGNTILTVDSLHGPPPPPPTPADIFGHGFTLLCFAGIGLMAREDRQRLSPRELLDGGIAALGAGAVCAAFVLDHVPRQPGESTVGTVSRLAFPIGFVVLVLLVVGAATVSAGRSRTAWVALTAAFALLAVGSALGAALGMAVAVRTLTQIQWPVATLLIAAAISVSPGGPDPLAARRGVAVWIPALASAAAIAVLFAATARHVDQTATALAAVALLLAMARGYGELRHEVGTRERTEKSLRASEADYRRVADEQAALRRVATLVAQGNPAAEVFRAVASEARRVLALDSSALVRFESDGTATLLAADAGLPLPVPVGERMTLDPGTAAAQVQSTGRPARVGAYESAMGPTSQELRRLGFRRSIGAPIVVEGRMWGAMLASWGEDRDPSADSEEGLVQFTELVATAVANAQSRVELIASRARIVAAADHTRRTIERNLHDGAQQRLVSLALKLRAAQGAAPPDLAKELDAITKGLNGASEELRELARGIHPSILARDGLQPALKALARRSVIPVELDVRAAGRLPEPVETAAYYVVSEALTNAAKHAHASRVIVEADVSGDLLRVAVRDDGAGGADFTRGSGLVGLKDRVEALGGRIQLDSPRGAGTSLKAQLPLILADGEIAPVPPGGPPDSNASRSAASAHGSR